MKWRSVKPKPWEFFWRTSVRGPFQPTPTPSLPGRVAIGGRGLSPAEERPSLRPLACGHGQKFGEIQEGLCIFFSIFFFMRVCCIFSKVAPQLEKWSSFPDATHFMIPWTLLLGITLAAFPWSLECHHSQNNSP